MGGGRQLQKGFLCDTVTYGVFISTDPIPLIHKKTPHETNLPSINPRTIRAGRCRACCRQEMKGGIWLQPQWGLFLFSTNITS